MNFSWFYEYFIPKVDWLHHKFTVEILPIAWDIVWDWNLYSWNPENLLSITVSGSMQDFMWVKLYVSTLTYKADIKHVKHKIKGIDIK